MRTIKTLEEAHRIIAELEMEIKETKRKHDAACEKIGWLKGKLSECGIPIRIGDMTIFTIIKGGKALLSKEITP